MCHVCILPHPFLHTAAAVQQGGPHTCLAPCSQRKPQPPTVPAQPARQQLRRTCIAVVCHVNVIGLFKHVIQAEEGLNIIQRCGSICSTTAEHTPGW